MHYHDNFVNFTAFGDYKIQNVTFTVTEFDITPGQDPNNDHRIGEVLTLPQSPGQLNFFVGRKSSDGVASWFNTRIQSNENTFDHTAESLNFAFLGTLVLTFYPTRPGTDTGTPSGPSRTYTINNVCLAQGHWGLANNWWIGVQGSSNTGGDTIVTVALESSSFETRVSFTRGDANGTDNILFTVDV